jgi:virulence-associated protein VapD
MKHSNHSQSDDSLKEISNIFHPNPDGSYYINHNCFLVDNHIVIPNQIYLLFDYFEDSVSSIIPFRLEDILIVDDFIMVVGLDLVNGEELGRNEFLINNAGCAFKLMDFEYLKTIMNKTEAKTTNLLVQPESL